MSSGPAAEDGGPRPRRRWPRWAAVPLLVLVPAGYLVVSALQSRSPAAAQEVREEMAGLVHYRPAPVQRHVYQVPIPHHAANIGFFEANSWQTSSLFVQFTTTPAGLRRFLGRLGTSPAQLRDGLVTVSVPAAERSRVGWRFPPGHHWAGLHMAQPGLHPVHDITVDLDAPAHPAVFVVSTISFGHRPAAPPSSPGRPPAPSAASGPAPRPGPAPRRLRAPSAAPSAQPPATAAPPSTAPEPPGAGTPAGDPDDAPRCPDDD